MPAPQQHSARRGLALADAVRQSTTGFIVFDEAGVARETNEATRALLAPVDPLGCRFAEVVRAAAKYGILPSAEARRLEIWHETANPAPTEWRSLSGGTLSLRASPLAEGGSLIEVYDVTELLKQSELGIRDALTGLANRAEFHARLDEAFVRFARTGEVTAVICIDLDRFKTINDTLGHPMGTCC